MRIIKSLQIYIPLILVLFSASIKAENLADVYELALKNDPLLKAAEATYRAGKENRVQGIAGLLPTLSVGGSTNWNEYRVEEQLIDQYNSNSYLASLNQPIFRLDKWFQFERGTALSEAASAEFAYQQQETMQNIADAGGVANLAGGGIAKEAGDSSGRPPVSGPNPQGLLSLKNRVRNY